MNEYLIEKTIKREQLKKLILPILYIGILLDIIFLSGFSKALNPIHISNFNTSYETISLSAEEGLYISTKIDTLYYTGITKETKGKINSYIYAYIKDDIFVLVMLNPKSVEKKGDNDSDNPPSLLTNITVNGRIKPVKILDSSIYTDIENSFDWNGGNLSSISGNFYLEDTKFILNKLSGLFIFIIILMIIAILYIIHCVIIFFVPYLHKGLKPLRAHGNVRIQVREADLEVLNNVKDYNNHTFITDNYYVRLKNGAIKVKHLKKGPLD